MTITEILMQLSNAKVDISIAKYDYQREFSVHLSGKSGDVGVSSTAKHANVEVAIRTAYERFVGTAEKGAPMFRANALAAPVLDDEVSY